MFCVSKHLRIILLVKFKVFNMDGRRFIDAIFKSQSSRPITQVVMNLPQDAAEYLGA